MKPIIYQKKIIESSGKNLKIKTNKMAQKKQIEIIREKCDELGLNIYDVFREAKVPACTVSNWKKNEPSSFKTLHKINEAIETLSEKIETE